jgi:hypothetical protein
VQAVARHWTAEAGPVCGRRTATGEQFWLRPPGRALPPALPSSAGLDAAGLTGPDTRVYLIMAGYHPAEISRQQKGWNAAP